MTDKQMWNIGKHGVPKEYTACPACGKQYGHHKTKVCLNCQECEPCCEKSGLCDSPDYQPSEVAINKIMEGE